MIIEDKSGWYWHQYHDQLVSFCFDENSRRRAIDRKLESAIRLELRQLLFRLVRGELPAGFRSALRGNQGTASQEDAWREHGEEITALHAIECPNCPWDGKTIFPQTAAEAAGGEKQNESLPTLSLQIARIP